MAKKLILSGVVQGVFCRNYCSKYARQLGVRGSATNLRNGNVSILLQTDDEDTLAEYIMKIKNNPDRFTFYGTIQNIEVFEYSGPLSGDYTF